MKKQQKPRWRQEGSRMVATLPNSIEDQIAAEHRANREAAKADGRLGPRSGLGAWGGSKKQKIKRDRKRAKVLLSKAGHDA